MHCAFTETSTVTGVSRDAGPRAAPETTLPPQLERRQDIRAVSAVAFAPCKLSQRGSPAASYAVVAAIAALGDGSL
jgi:hypothetical protein